MDKWWKNISELLSYKVRIKEQGKIGENYKATIVERRGRRRKILYIEELEIITDSQGRITRPYATHWPLDIIETQDGLYGILSKRIVKFAPDGRKLKPKLISGPYEHVNVWVGLKNGSLVVLPYYTNEVIPTQNVAYTVNEDKKAKILVISNDTVTESKEYETIQICGISDGKIVASVKEDLGNRLVVFNGSTLEEMLSSEYYSGDMYPLKYKESVFMIKNECKSKIVKFEINGNKIVEKWSSKEYPIVEHTIGDNEIVLLTEEKQGFKAILLEYGEDKIKEKDSVSIKGEKLIHCFGKEPLGFEIKTKDKGPYCVVEAKEGKLRTQMKWSEEPFY